MAFLSLLIPLCTVRAKVAPPQIIRDYILEVGDPCLTASPSACLAKGTQQDSGTTGGSVRAGSGLHCGRFSQALEPEWVRCGAGRGPEPKSEPKQPGTPEYCRGRQHVRNYDLSLGTGCRVAVALANSAFGCPLAPWLPGTPAQRELVGVVPGLGQVPRGSPGPREAWRGRFRSGRAPPLSRLQLRPGPRGLVGWGEDGISQRGGLGCPASRRALSVYGEKGEMEKAGRRRLESAAPPLGRLRRSDSGADEGVSGARAAPGSFGSSDLDCAPRSGARRPGSRFCCRRAWGPRSARLPGAAHQLRGEPSGDRGGSALPAGPRGGRRLSG